MNDSNTTLSTEMLAGYLLGNQLTIYAEVSVLLLLILHIASTFELEVELVWKAKQSKITILFYVIRYFPPLCLTLALLGNSSHGIKYWGKTCEAWWWFEGVVCVTVSQILADVLMVMIIVVLYEFSRPVCGLLGVVCLVRAVVGIWGGAIQVASVSRLPWPRDAIPLPGCPNAAPGNLFATQISIVVNVTSSGIVLLCLLNQCISRHPLERSFLGSWRDFFGLRTSWPIVHVLIRDGCLNFLVIFVVEVMVMIIFSVTQSALTVFVFPFVMAAYCIPATRFVLNLRARSRTNREYSQPGVRADQIVVDDMTQLNFAPRNSFDVTTQHLSSWGSSRSGKTDLEHNEHVELVLYGAQDLKNLGSHVQVQRDVENEA